MVSQGTANSQNNLEKTKRTKKARGLILCDFKTYYKAMGMKAVWYWHKDRHIGQ